jgi:pSer/pThr/pTyr-binding forkhead associated (FHA) protein
MVKYAKCRDWSRVQRSLCTQGAEEVGMPRLKVIEGPIKGQDFEFSGDTVFIGRSSKNDIQIHDPGISRKQIKIFLIGGKFFVEDLKSTNGTSLNGRMITPGEGFQLGEEDMIAIGNTVLQLCELPPVKTLAAKALEDQRDQLLSRQEDWQSTDRRSKSPKNLELIYKITELLRKSMTINEFLHRVLGYILEALPRIDRAAIVLFEKQGEHVREVIARPRQHEGTEAFQYSKTVVERVMRDKKAVRMSDTLYEPESALSREKGEGRIRSVLCVPMIIKSHVFGAIYVDSLRVPYGFRRDDLLLLNSLSGSVAVAIENAQLEARGSE